MSDEECQEAEKTILREFRLWADNPMCDAERQQNFYGMQQLSFLSMLMSGDVFALFGMKENKRTPYQTTVRLLEADRVCTPDSSGDSISEDAENGNRIVDGVEIDQEGAVVRYHVASKSPLADSNTSELVWTAVDAFGKDTGYPNILHVMTYWEDSLLELPLINLSKKISLVFNRIRTRNKPFLAVDYLRLSIVSGGYSPTV